MGKPSLPIILDRERNLRFDYNAFCDVEKEAGSDCMEPGFWDDVTPVKLRALLWAGLRWEDPFLKVEKVGNIIEKLIEENRYQEVQLAIIKAYQMAFPSKGEPEAST